MSELERMRREAVHDTLFTAIREEIDDSLAFVSGTKILPRRQRHPRVGSAVRDYLADEIAWKVLDRIAVLEGRLEDANDELEFLRPRATEH